MAFIAASVLRIRDRSLLGCFWRPRDGFCLLAALIRNNGGVEGFVGSLRNFVERLVGGKEEEGRRRIGEFRSWGFIAIGVAFGGWRRRRE